MTTMPGHFMWFAANFNSRRFSIRYFLFHFCAFQLGPETAFDVFKLGNRFLVLFGSMFKKKVMCGGFQHSTREKWSLVWMPRIPCVQGSALFFHKGTLGYEHLSLSPNYRHRLGCSSQSTVCFPFPPPKLNMLQDIHSGCNASGSWRRPKVEHWNWGMTHGVVVNILVATS